MGIEFILLTSIIIPWNALFFSFPFVFLKESPRVSFNLSKPNWPQLSAYCPNLAFAWNELSFSSSLIYPTSSTFILEKNFLGPLFSWLYLTYLVNLGFYSYYSSSSFYTFAMTFYLIGFSIFFSIILASLTSFLTFFLGSSSKESFYDS